MDGRKEMSMNDEPGVFVSGNGMSVHPRRSTGERLCVRISAARIIWREYR
jgi:hypothetical protein